MDNLNQPFATDQHATPSYGNPHLGEVYEPFSNPTTTTTEGSPQRISRRDRYSTPNTTVGSPLGDPLLPLLLIITLSLITKTLIRHLRIKSHRDEIR